MPGGVAFVAQMGKPFAHDLQRAAAGLGLFAEPMVDTTSDFAELVPAMPGVAAMHECRRLI